MATEERGYIFPALVWKFLGKDSRILDPVLILKPDSIARRQIYYDWPRLGYVVYILLEAGERWSWANKNNRYNKSLLGVYFQFFKYYYHKDFSIEFYASPEDLDKITEEDDSHGTQGKRKAASEAAVQQRKILLEGSDGDSANDSEPDYDTGKLRPTSKLILWKFNNAMVSKNIKCMQSTVLNAPWGTHRTIKFSYRIWGEALSGDDL